MNGHPYLEHKAELRVEGIHAIPEALNEVGKKYKEQNHGLFGWDSEDHADRVLPDDFVLPDGTVVQFRKNSHSPNPGSSLEGHRAPTGKWFVDTILEASEIVYEAKIPPGTENHCYRCDGNSLLHDALRLKGIE